VNTIIDRERVPKGGGKGQEVTLVKEREGNVVSRVLRGVAYGKGIRPLI